MVENETVENTETTLSDAERTAVQEIVSQSLESTARNVAREEYTNLVTASQVEVGDELSPRWMKDSVRFLNLFAMNRDGRAQEAVAKAKELHEARAQLTTSAKTHEVKEALRIIQDSGLSKSQQMRIQSTLNNADGGFLLPKPFLAEIFVTLEEYGVARRTFRGIPMGSKTLDLKDVAAKPVVYWENENAKIRETSIEFGEKQLVAKKLAALLPWTMELQEDEVFGVISLASQLFGEQLAFSEDKAGFLGGGSLDTANGGQTGMLNLANAIVYNLGGSNGSGKTSFSDLTFDDLSAAYNSLSLARKRNARWFVHHSIIGVLERIKDNDGYVYRKPAAPGMPGTIWGYPVEVVEVLPNVADPDQVGKRFMAFGDPSNMLFGNRRGVTFDVGREGTILGSTTENSYSAFQQDGAILRVTERIAFQTPLDSNFVVIKTAAS
jgi:HK97 family phage major capsid protein